MNETRFQSIRMFQVPNSGSATPQIEVMPGRQHYWRMPCENGSKQSERGCNMGFSAVCWLYARDISVKLDRESAIYPKKPKTRAAVLATSVCSCILSLAPGRAADSSPSPTICLLRGARAEGMGGEGGLPAIPTSSTSAPRYRHDTRPLCTWSHGPPYPLFCFFWLVCARRCPHAAAPRPLGMIETNVGGTPDEKWSSPDALARCNISTADPHSGTSSLWNGMVVPLINTTIHGAIW